MSVTRSNLSLFAPNHSQSQVEQILPAMSKAKALHCADLSHNNIGDGAVWKLEEVIKAQACLQVLDLCDVRFTPAVAQALETVIGAVGPDMHMVIVDVQMGRALLKAGRARRRLAKASGETKPPVRSLIPGGPNPAV